jgi:hypothetical protein
MCALAVVLFAGGVAGAAAGADRSLDEYSARAALVLNLARFAGWPQPPVDRFSICVQGEDGFVPVLQRLLVDQRVSGRPLAVRRLDDGAEPVTCHVLYVGSDERHVRNLLLRAPAALTIGESPDFIRDGGVVRLFIGDDRLRFEVSQEAATRAGIRIPAQVLKLSSR